MFLKFMFSLEIRFGKITVVAGFHACFFLDVQVQMVYKENYHYYKRVMLYK